MTTTNYTNFTERQLEEKIKTINTLMASLGNSKELEEDLNLVYKEKQKREERLRRIEEIEDEIEQGKALRDNRLYSDYFDKLQAKIDRLEEEKHKLEMEVR